ncbi:TRAP transporter substrate-binding protein [Marinicella litoralis]|uniref:TRAP-type mannitol/chloroaromatic compound transport system substrate-binding protein n=1 Tax=Marinicella litoralis TaxID=644220 RepID=A0A4R6XSB0_9GAMM|nr:TRAP transporter substrate-binding protein [Marinicella litoralis]TDR20837.1 TRAP-type mannitol/chloroaromatic compound transport system substrate-binding protein [Marinicella litoralis]
MKRRQVIAGGALAASLAVSGCKEQQQAKKQQSTENFEWKMVTAWPKNFPGLGTGAAFLADAITQMSGGRLTVKVFGSGELVPAFEVFDAVSAGTAQMGHSAAYYWKGKIPEAQFFGAVPFGMNANEMNAWLYHGGGLKLWEEAYRPFGLKPMPAGQSGVQMGGWFNKEIKTKEDIKGLVMRIPGMGGDVLSRAGGTPQALPGAELFTALQTGTIDATEWVGPYNDLAFGLYQAAQFYYYPGWHEPTACIEAIINQQAYDALPVDLQKVVDMAAMAANQNMLSEYTANNQRALETLQQDHHVQLRAFPEDVLQEFKKYANQVLIELGQQSELSQKIFNSYTGFAEQTKKWLAVSEMAYLKAR